ncbi:MAG: metalloregulator ArsR/SmtB family transcription factor [Candidatus Omnitrophica bacterium]|nr:metalloregulator ArsR/SmtB family transcription factor [Candidatus Omnitrophota bacterium]
MKKTEKFLRAVADDKRLRILKMLEKKSMCVCEITAVLGIRQPTVSRHLKRLEKVGLIDQKQNGFYTDCRIVKGHPFRHIWRLLNEKLEDSMEIRSDRHKMTRVDRYKLCQKRTR